MDELDTTTNRESIFYKRNQNNCVCTSQLNGKDGYSWMKLVTSIPALVKWWLSLSNPFFLVVWRDSRAYLRMVNLDWKTSIFQSEHNSYYRSLGKVTYIQSLFSKFVYLRSFLTTSICLSDGHWMESRWMIICETINEDISFKLITCVT